MLFYVDFGGSWLHGWPMRRRTEGRHSQRRRSRWIARLGSLRPSPTMNFSVLVRRRWSFSRATERSHYMQRCCIRALWLFAGDVIGALPYQALRWMWTHNNNNNTVDAVIGGWLVKLFTASERPTITSDDIRRATVTVQAAELSWRRRVDQWRGQQDRGHRCLPKMAANEGRNTIQPVSLLEWREFFGQYAPYIQFGKK